MLLAERNGGRRCGPREEQREAAAPAPRAEVGAAPGRGGEVRGAGGEARGDARGDRRAARRTRCSTPAATARRSRRCRRKRAEVQDGLAARRGAVARRARAAGGGGGGLMLELLVPAFVTLFVVIDPIGLAPLFIALTQGMTAERARRASALRALVVAFVLLAAFGLFGERAADRHRHLDAGLPHLGRAAPVPDRGRHAVRAPQRPARAAARPRARPTRRCFRWRCR